MSLQTWCASEREGLTGPQGYTVFSLGAGVLYRPHESKVRNVKAKDYLGQARLVAASDAQNAFTGFTGAEVKKAGIDTAQERVEKGM